MTIKQLLAAAATATLISVPSFAITIDSHLAALGPGGGGDKTLVAGFDPGTSDKMVVIVSGEHGFPNNIGGKFNTMTLNGVELTQIIEEEAGIPTIAAYYLDDPGTAGIGDLIVNQANHNGTIYSIYLLSDTAAGVGASNTSTGQGLNSVDLTTTGTDSLVLVGHHNSGPNGGNGAGNAEAVAPLVEDTPYLEQGNTWVSLSTAHTTVATAGANTFSYLDDDPNDLIAMVAVEILGDAGPTLPGDTDGDNDIDDADLGTAFSNFTGPVGAAGGKTASEGDTDGDGDVDDADLANAFSGFTGPLGPAAVPEPASLALLGLGGLLVARRRRA